MNKDCRRDAIEFDWKILKLAPAIVFEVGAKEHILRTTKTPFRANPDNLYSDEDMKDLEEWAIERMEWEYIYEVQIWQEAFGYPYIIRGC